MGGPPSEETEPALHHSEIIDINGNTLDSDLDPRPPTSLLGRTSYIYARDDAFLNGYHDPRTAYRIGPHLRRHSTGTDPAPRLSERLPYPATLLYPRDGPFEEDYWSSPGDDRCDTGET
eukprot:GEMP01084655.1.p1 GENE.GEMP01084655.1~~GEMP01084655.1.p1  ORF type:complete len:119 (+),score=12.22 GEMP01084655.1:356-712(+)